MNTPNLNLVKPEITDMIGQTIEDIAENAGKVDDAYGDMQTSLQLLMGNMITEFDSNSNGNYVRWANGLQVCWHVRTNIPVETSKSFAQSLEEFRATVSWTFPSPFIDTNIYADLSSTRPRTEDTVSNSRVLSYYHYNDPTTTGTNTQISCLTDFDELPRVFFFAIGRWK